MGRATRWLRGFLGMKKDRDNVVDSLSPASGDKSEKKRWSFSKPSKEPSSHPLFADVQQNVPARPSAAGDGLRRSSYVVDTEKEQQQQQQQQSRHVNAIAVATATAAAADAAVAAAEAAVAVVRLTEGSWRGASSREVVAAMKIQCVFRGFLARKALRALRGIVQLQALIRGYLVRKRAATILQQMQSLIRAQSTVRSQRARRSLDKENRYPVEHRPRRSTERYDESRSEFHSKRLLGSLDIVVDHSPKVVEVDSVKPWRSSRQICSSPLSESRNRILYSSPISGSCRVSGRCRGNQPDLEWCLVGNEYECQSNSTVHNSSPGFTTLAKARAPSTPVVRGVRGAREGPFHHHHHHHPYYGVPSYMANTKSFRAKVRSQSAPRQRRLEDLAGERLSLSEIMASRNSVSGVRMERSFSHLEEIFE